MSNWCTRDTIDDVQEPSWWFNKIINIQFLITKSYTIKQEFWPPMPSWNKILYSFTNKERHVQTCFRFKNKKNIFYDIDTCNRTQNYNFKVSSILLYDYNWDNYTIVWIHMICHQGGALVYDPFYSQGWESG